jgi:hypothetical protein
MDLLFLLFSQDDDLMDGGLQLLSVGLTAELSGLFAATAAPG